MNVLVAGLTGSGKTTYTSAVARSLGAERVSGSGLRRSGFQPSRGASPSSLPDRAYWLFSAEATAVDVERTAPGARDDDVDRLLLAECHERHQAIFDVWFLPWLARDRALKIWLDAPVEVRAQRVQRQLEEEGTPGKHDDVFGAVQLKDLRARDYGLLHYGIDIFLDRGPFDVICDTGCDISPDMMTTVLSSVCRWAFGNDVLPLPPAVAPAAKMCLVRCPDDLMAALGLSLYTSI